MYAKDAMKKFTLTPKCLAVDFGALSPEAVINPQPGRRFQNLMGLVRAMVGCLR
jgi:hypothetical protein